MSGFKIGCQTITWGNDQYEFFPEMLGEIREAGFEGVEVCASSRLSIARM